MSNYASILKREPQKPPPTPNLSRPTSKVLDQNVTKPATNPGKNKPNAPPIKTKAKKQKPSQSQVLAPQRYAMEYPTLDTVASSSLLPTISTWGRPLDRSIPTKVKSNLQLKRDAPTKVLQRKETPAKQEVQPKSKPIASLLDAFAPKQRDIGDENTLSLLTLYKKLRPPRKKKFSSLKKKVLQERLTQWRALNPISLVGGPCTVELKCFSSGQELDDEYDEIVDNLKDMAAKVGEYKAVYIPRDGNPTAYVWFTNSGDAAAAQSVWDGLVLGGEKVQATVASYDYGCSTIEQWQEALIHTNTPTDEATTLSTIVLENVLTQDDLDDPDCLEESLADIRRLVEKYGQVGDLEILRETVVVKYLGSQSDAEKAIRYLHGTLLGGSVVTAKLAEIESPKNITIVIKNVLTVDDYEDEDCLEESLNDIKSLVSKYIAVVAIKADSSDGGIVYIEIDASTKNALSIVQELDGTIIGGQKASVTLKADDYDDHNHVSGFVLLRNVLTEDDLEDDDCLEESKNDIASLAGRFGNLVKLEVHRTESSVLLEYLGGATVAETAAHGLNGMVIGGQTLAASRVASREEEFPSEPSLMASSSSAIAKEKGNELPSKPDQLFSGDKLISERFAEMKRAPKIANAGIPRKYASLVSDDDVKPLLVEMLGELMRLQKKAVEEKNTKVKRRLVMGLREVARGIRAHKVKMVIMANNLDAYGALDEKLQEILELSNQESIPIFYEFNKKKLGQAIGKNIKIAVIGIQNAEGTLQQFKKLTTLARLHNLT